MRAYPVNLRKDGKFILVTFPDIPEAITQGNDRALALEMAREALEMAMDFYFDDRRPVPAPSQPNADNPLSNCPLVFPQRFFCSMRCSTRMFAPRNSRGASARLPRSSIGSRISGTQAR